MSMGYHFSKALLGVAFAALSVGYAAPAAAQAAPATRTWVSGLGDDENPCTRTAPCQTFQAALAATMAGGEIDCLDPGGFGAVTIDKSVTIYCPFTDGGVVVSGTDAIVINDGGAGTIYVVLDGLNLEGLGKSTLTPGVRGISFLSGRSLTVRNATIRNFNDASNGIGISFTPSQTANLTVTDSLITGNGAGSLGGGIFIRPTGTGVSRASLNNVTIENNTGVAVRIDNTATGGGGNISVVVDDSQLDGNSAGLVVVAPSSPATPVVVNAVGSSMSNNTGSGVIANGALGEILVGDSVITGNATGVLAVNGAMIFDTGGNRLNHNTNNGAFSGGEE
jgi:hypothetical protein